MQDLISRQDAIEEIANQSRFSAEEIINICNKSVQDENGWLGGLKEAIQAVIELPSAEPEIVKCKDCRFNTYSKKCLNPDSFFLVPADDFYCGYAERRTDEQTISE